VEHQAPLAVLSLIEATNNNFLMVTSSEQITHVVYPFLWSPAAAGLRNWTS